MRQGSRRGDGYTCGFPGVQGSCASPYGRTERPTVDLAGVERSQHRDRPVLHVPDVGCRHRAGAVEAIATSTPASSWSARPGRRLAGEAGQASMPRFGASVWAVHARGSASARSRSPAWPGSRSRAHGPSHVPSGVGHPAEPHRVVPDERVHLKPVSSRRHHQRNTQAPGRVPQSDQLQRARTA